MKKKGRPKKVQKTVRDNRTPNSGPPGFIFDKGQMSDDELAFCRRYVAIWNAALDPMNEFPELLPIFAPVIVGTAGESEKKAFGEFFDNLVCEASIEKAELVFRQIVKMKRNMAQRDRRAYALMAYSHYIDHAGKEPTKPQLKAYMIANKNHYRDMPDESDGKGWTRLWKESGLFALPDR